VTGACHFCGDTTIEGGRLLANGELNTCYAECVCGHIGHEHIAGSCRGGEYGPVFRTSTDCNCTNYTPTQQEG
jgi:hypothetical protein